MASPKTRRVLQDIRHKDDNNVNTAHLIIWLGIIYKIFIKLFCVLIYVAMFWVRNAQPPVGIC